MGTKVVAFELPPGGRGAVDLLVTLASGAARELQPGFPTGESLVEVESSYRSADLGTGEYTRTVTRRLGRPPRFLQVEIVTNEFYDGVSPSWDAIKVVAEGLPPGCAVRALASVYSPAHMQPSRASVTVAAPDELLVGAVATVERLRDG